MILIDSRQKLLELLFISTEFIYFPQTNNNINNNIKHIFIFFTIIHEIRLKQVTYIIIIIKKKSRILPFTAVFFFKP